MTGDADHEQDPKSVCDVVGSIQINLETRQVPIRFEQGGYIVNVTKQGQMFETVEVGG